MKELNFNPGQTRNPGGTRDEHRLYSNCPGLVIHPTPMSPIQGDLLTSLWLCQNIIAKTTYKRKGFNEAYHCKGLESVIAEPGATAGTAESSHRLINNQ